jgi:2-polyprenyl-6-methoxyphenol hydroxylase-like FAD-dependent oxidoreductase
MSLPGFGSVSMANLHSFQIGGSLTGLMHGIMLRSLGHNVHIIEQSQSVVRSDHAAGITAQPQVVEFFRRYGFSKETWSVHCPGVQFLDANANVKWFIKKPLEMTSWTVLYNHLRERFDYRQKDNLDQGSNTTSEPTATWSFGRRATNIVDGGKAVTIEFEELPHRQTGSIKADLVLVAEGSGSTARRILLPGTDRRYSGYLAWRGTVTEANVSDETRKVLGSRLTYFCISNSYILWFVLP